MEAGNRWGRRGIAFRVEKWHFLGRYATATLHPTPSLPVCLLAACLLPAAHIPPICLAPLDWGSPVTSPLSGRTGGRGRPRRYLRRG